MTTINNDNKKNNGLCCVGFTLHLTVFTALLAYDAVDSSNVGLTSCIARAGDSVLCIC